MSAFAGSSVLVRSMVVASLNYAGARCALIRNDRINSLSDLYVALSKLGLISKDEFTALQEYASGSAFAIADNEKMMLGDEEVLLIAKRLLNFAFEPIAHSLRE